MIRVMVILLCLPLLTSAAEFTTDGTAADWQAKHNAASPGDTVWIGSAPGNYAWSHGVTNSRGVLAKGYGAGRNLSYSRSSVAIGTGAKNFTLHTNGLAIANGQTLRIFWMGSGTGFPVSLPNGRTNWMQGTVTSYSGTALAMNITSTSGSGTRDYWVIETASATVVTNNSGGGPLLTLTHHSTHRGEFSDFKIAAGNSTNRLLQINGSGVQVHVHDMIFERGADQGDAVNSTVNSGLIYNCSFNSSPFSLTALAIHLQADGDTTAWTTAFPWGNTDTNGTAKFYVEDSDFHGWLHATDFDNNGKAVVRYCLMNSAGIGTHGPDTSNFGQRAHEVYNVEFVHRAATDGSTFPLNHWFYGRGGTMVVTDCIIPEITSQDYPNKPTFDFTVMNLQRNGGPNPCWGANNPGNQYPAPRQVGMGRVTGAAGNDAITYRGDSEPIYIFRNTGTGTNQVARTDYGGSDCTSPDSSSGYIVENRDYFVDGTVKPGFVKLTYPHPARGAAPPSSSVGAGGAGLSGNVTINGRATLN